MADVMGSSKPRSKLARNSAARSGLGLMRASKPARTSAGIWMDASMVPRSMSRTSSSQLSST